MVLLMVNRHLECGLENFIWVSGKNARKKVLKTWIFLDVWHGLHKDNRYSGWQSRGNGMISWTDNETEKFFSFIGKHVIYCQFIEDQLDQIILLAYGHENWEKTQNKISRMDFKKKEDEVRSVVLEKDLFGQLQSHVQWCKQFQDLMDEVAFERQRRNSIVHSQFLFHFIESGMPPLRSNLRKQETEWFDLSKADEILKGIGELIFKISQARVQLIHVYKKN